MKMLLRDWLDRRGFAQLAAHVPDLDAGRGPLIVVAVLASFAAASLLMIAADRRGPAWGAAVQVVVVMAAFFWVGAFFWRRAAYQSRWGARAYRNAFGRHLLTGLPAIFAVLVHNGYGPGERLALGAAAPVLFAVAAYLLVTGVALWARAAFTFGFDNLALLYVYFPHEGRLVDSRIYSIIRHPVYAGVVRWSMALGFLRGTWFSTAFALLIPAGLFLWVRLVEERELVERFGERYTAYRGATPAFWPRTRDVLRYWRFLLLGG